MIARQTVLADVIGIIGELMGDWDFDAEVREDSLLFKDLGLESIEAVALASAVEEKYGREIPFAELLMSLQTQEQRDFTIGQLVDFLTRTLNAEAAEQISL